MSVFADTSALYAAIVRTEERHRESLSAFKKLIESGRAVKTTSYVVLETAADCTDSRDIDLFNP